MQHRTYVSLAYWARKREERHLQDEPSSGQETLPITGQQEVREMEVIEGRGIALLPDIPDAA